MSVILNVFKMLPGSLRIVLLVVVGYALFQIFTLIGPFLTPLAVLAWLVAGAAMLRAAGQLQVLDRVPIVASALDMMVPRAAIAVAAYAPAGLQTPTPPATAPMPAVTDTSSRATDADRERVLAQAQRALASMAGVAEAYAQLGALANQAILAQQRGLSGFGSAAPAIVLVLQGPSGTGKSLFARHAADLLYGIGAIARRNMAELGHDIVSIYGVDSQSLQSKLDGAPGGVLLLDDADWLVSATDGAGPPPGLNVTGTIVSYAERHPGMLLVMCTASERPGRQITTDPGQRLWRAKVDMRAIVFRNMDDEALWSVLQTQVAEKRLQIESAAAANAGKLLAAWRRADGAEFRNAHAVRDLVDKSFAALSRRVTESGDVTGREAITITNADIVAAAHELDLPI